MRHLRRIVILLAVLVVVWGVLQMGVLPTGTGDLSQLLGNANLTSSAANTVVDTSNTVASDPTTEGQYPNGFAYSCITQAQQAVYDQLLQGTTAREASFTIQCPDTDDIEPALRALLEDHPELFWLDGAATYQRSSIVGSSVTITPSTNVSLDQVDGIQATIDEEVNTWLSSLPTDASDYDKVRSAYEWVIENTDYDLSSDQNQNIQSVFVSHRSVCAGYAKAFQYLLHRAGVW